MTVNHLPPMPASSGRAIEWNIKDGYYGVKARDFWDKAEVIREEIGPDIKCDHEFKVMPTGAQCSKCNFGLIGPIEVKEAKLFYKGKRLPL